MYDFRVGNNRIFPTDKVNSNSVTKRVLEPIAENQNAHISHLYMPKPTATRNFINSSASTLTELS